MINDPNSDNIYKTGSQITALDNPDQALTIVKYYHRIYYCNVTGKPNHKQLAYFEKELIPPEATDSR